MVTSHPSALGENGLEIKVLPLQPGLACIGFSGSYFPPPVGDNDYVFEISISKKLSECGKAPRRYSTNPIIGHPVEIKDSGELGTPFVSACEAFF